MGAEERDDARAVGMGVHQAVELLLGVFLVISSTRVPEGGAGVVLGFGALLLVLPALTVGPLAALRVLSPGVHKVADMVLVMAAVASPLLPLGLEGNAVLIVVVSGLALAVLARATSYRVRRPRPRRPTPPSGPPAAAAVPAPARPPDWARTLGAAAGRARTQLPRQAGRMVGRLKKGRSSGAP